MDVGFHDGGVDPQAPPAYDPALTREGDQPLQQAVEHPRVDQVRETNEGLGVRHSLATDAAEGTVDEAAPDFPLAFVETPLREVLEDQHAQDHGGGGAEATAALTQRIAPREPLDDQVDERFIVENGIDLTKRRIPELVAIGQQHLEDTALRIRTTDHGASMEAQWLPT